MALDAVKNSPGWGTEPKKAAVLEAEEVERTVSYHVAGATMLSQLKLVLVGLFVGGACRADDIKHISSQDAFAVFQRRSSRR